MGDKRASFVLSERSSDPFAAGWTPGVKSY